MTRLVIVQHIETHWTKDAHRGKVPDVAKIPLHQIDMSKVVMVNQEVGRRHLIGHSKAHPDIKTFTEFAPIQIGCITVTASDTDVIGEFKYNRDYGGAPVREWTSKTMILRPNEWGQMMYNGRFSEWESAWHYRKVVVNFGIFDEPYSTVFTETTPTKQFSSLARLYY